MVKKPNPKSHANGNDPSRPAAEAPANPQQRTFSIPDTRLEKPAFKVTQSRDHETVRYEIIGDLNAPAPRLSANRNT